MLEVEWSGMRNREILIKIQYNKNREPYPSKKRKNTATPFIFA